MTTPTLLVLAKAPVPGFAKTRLARTIGDDAAARLAAAALLDTLEVASATGWPVVVAMTGELQQAVAERELREALRGCRVVQQRGDELGERIAHAHADADDGHGVVQVGMDTPQVTVEDYEAARAGLDDGASVIGPAADGGWWLLGVPDAGVTRAVADVPMSRPDTGELTEQALAQPLVRLRVLRDMDTWDDALELAGETPASRLAAAVSAVRQERT